MKVLIIVAMVAVAVSGAPSVIDLGLAGLGHNGAVILGGLGGLGLVPSTAVIGPQAPSVAVLGPAASSAAVIGPNAGSAAIVGPAAPSTVVAGPSGAIVAPGLAGAGSIITAGGLLGRGIW